MASSPSTEPIDLNALLQEMRYELYDIEADEPSPPLIAARLADQMRDLGMQPLTPEDYDILTMDLDEEGWRRLSLLVETIQEEAIEDHLQAMPNLTAPALFEQVLLHLASTKELLPVELMNLSEIRLEEFGRGLVNALDAPILGESHEESARRLEEIDYERLLGEADRAKDAAEERLAELRRIQEEERAAYERSKW